MEHSVAFQDIGNARANFEANFAKAELGGIFKEIVIRSTPNSDIYKDENINRLLGSAMNEVAGSAFNNIEANRETFVGSVKETIQEFTSMEADYRQQKILARLEAGHIDWGKEKDRVLALEYMESKGFKSPILKEEYKNKMQFIFSLEAQDIVLEIGKEVGSAIAQAENKNAVIATAINVIIEEKEKIKEDLKEMIEESADEADEEIEDASGDAEDDLDENEEELDANENETGEEDDDSDAAENEEAGEESADIKFQIFDENQETPEVGLDTQLNEGAAKALNEEIKAVVTEEEIAEYSEVDSEDTLDEKLNEETDNVEGSVESWMDLPKPIRVKYANIISQSVEDNQYGIEHILWQTSQNRVDINKALPVINSFKNVIFKDYEKIMDNASKKAKARRYVENENMTYGHRSLSRKAFFDTEWDDFISKIKKTKVGFTKKRFRIELLRMDTLSSAKHIWSIILLLFTHVLIGIPVFLIMQYGDEQYKEAKKTKATVSREIDGCELTYTIKARGNSKSYTNKNHRAYVVDLVCDVNFNPLKKKNKHLGKEAFVNRFREIKYSNKNIGLTLYPVSPNRFDDLKIPPVNELSNVFVKATENVGDFVMARLGALKEFVDREQDEALTSKFELYHKISTEALNLAEVKRDKMWKVGLTPKGIVNKEDPFNLRVGLNMAKLMTRGYEEFEDSVNEEDPSVNVQINVVNPEEAEELENSDDDQIIEEAGEEGAVEEAEQDKADQAEESFNRLIDKTFYLAGLRNEYKKYVSPQVKEKIQSIEGQLYEQISWLPEDKKDQIVNVMEFTTTALDPKALQTAAFLEDIKLAVDNTTIRTELATNTEESIFEKVRERVSSLLSRDLNADEVSLIRAISSNQDSVDTVPSIFEKFIIKLGKEEIKDESAELGEESLEFIKKKATALLAMHTFANKLDVMDKQSLEEFNEYVLGGYII